MNERASVGSQAEVDRKLARVRGYLSDSGAAGVLLARQDNFAWLTGGHDNHVVAGSEIGAVSLLVTARDHLVLTDRIEAPRVRDEELGAQRWDWRTVDWYRPGAVAAAARDIVGHGEILSDTDRAGFAPVRSEFDTLRAHLLPEEVDRYRIAGAMMTRAVLDTCQHVQIGQTEWEIAADLSRRVRAQGGRPNVVLIATDERIGRYRHPIPTGKKLRDYAMIVLGGSLWGLCISLTRFVSFHPLPDDLRRRWRDVSRLAAVVNRATTPGRAWSDIFGELTRAYADLGWGEEWTLHHQGGPTGYRGREFTATFDSPGVVAPVQAVAWNPSITGTKSEDTVIASESGIEFLTRAGTWPMHRIELGGTLYDYPDVLIKQNVMRRYA